MQCLMDARVGAWTPAPLALGSAALPVEPRRQPAVDVGEAAAVVLLLLVLACSKPEASAAARLAPRHAASARRAVSS